MSNNDLSSPAESGEISVVSMNNTDARLEPVVFEDKEGVQTTTKTAADYYKPRDVPAEEPVVDEIPHEVPRPVKPKTK